MKRIHYLKLRMHYKTVYSHFTLNTIHSKYFIVVYYDRIYNLHSVLGCSKDLKIYSRLLLCISMMITVSTEEIKKKIENVYKCTGKFSMGSTVTSLHFFKFTFQI